MRQLDDEDNIGHGVKLYIGLALFGVYAYIALNSSLDDEKARSPLRRFRTRPPSNRRRGPNRDASQHAALLSP